MDDIGSDYIDYENTKDLDGGLSPGRRTPGSGLLWAVGIAIMIIVLGALAIIIVPGK